MEHGQNQHTARSPTGAADKSVPRAPTQAQLIKEARHQIATGPIEGGSDQQRLNLQLAKKGLLQGYVPGDGDCLPAAVAVQLGRAQGEEPTPGEMRHKLVEFYRAHPEEFYRAHPETLSGEMTEHAREQHFANIGENKGGPQSWLSNFDVPALLTIYGGKDAVIHQCGAQPQRLSPVGAANPSGATIHLAWA